MKMFMKDCAPKYKTSLPYILIDSTCIIAAPTTRPITGMTKGLATSGTRHSSFCSVLIALTFGAAVVAPPAVAACLMLSVTTWTPFVTAAEAQSVQDSKQQRQSLQPEEVRASQAKVRWWASEAMWEDPALASVSPSHHSLAARQANW